MVHMKHCSAFVVAATLLCLFSCAYSERDIQLLVVDDDHSFDSVSHIYDSLFIQMDLNYTLARLNETGVQPDMFEIFAHNTVLWFCGNIDDTSSQLHGPTPATAEILQQWLAEGNNTLLLSCSSYLQDRGTSDFVEELLGINTYQSENSITKYPNIILASDILTSFDETLQWSEDFDSSDYPYTVVHPETKSGYSSVIMAAQQQVNPSLIKTVPIGVSRFIPFIKDDTTEYSRTYYFGVELATLDDLSFQSFLDFLLNFNDSTYEPGPPTPIATNCSAESCCNATSTFPCFGCEQTSIKSCVCDLDSYCCNYDWDDLCVDLATSNCSGQYNTECLSCNKGSCCVANSDSTCFGCNNSTIESCVCAIDPTCCTSPWITHCALLARSSCNSGDVCDCKKSDCFQTVGSPTPCSGCIDPEVEQCVCVEYKQPGCCTTDWDFLCRETAKNYCQQKPSSAPSSSPARSSAIPIFNSSDDHNNGESDALVALAVILSLVFCFLLCGVAIVLYVKRRAVKLRLQRFAPLNESQEEPAWIEY